jgi:hypothetical protein
MRGLPDSAVVGTYKRIHRKPKRQAPIVSYKEQGELVSGFLWAIATPLRKKLNKK